MMAIFAVWLILVMENQVRMLMDANVIVVMKLRISIIEVINGIVPIVQSAQRKLG